MDTVSDATHFEPFPTAICGKVCTGLLFAETRCMMETRSEQVSELCSTTMHCSVAGESCPAIPAVRLADGAGTVYTEMPLGDDELINF